MDRREGGFLLAAALVAAGSVALPGRGAAQAAAETPPPDAQPAPAPTESMSQATTSEADMNDERARAAFRLGRQFYTEGRFAEAASEFERAYGLSGRGQLLFNAYLAYRDARDDENAIRALRGYLGQVEDIPERTHLEARLAAMERQLEGERQAHAQAQAESEAARRDAEEARRSLEEERARPQGQRPWWPWLVVGGGGALIVTGIALGAVAGSDASSLRDDCPGDVCNPAADLEGRRSDVQTLAGAADALWITGALVAAAGVVLVFVLPDEMVEAEITPSAGCWGEGCALAVRGSF